MPAASLFHSRFDKTTLQKEVYEKTLLILMLYDSTLLLVLYSTREVKFLTYWLDI